MPLTQRNSNVSCATRQPEFQRLYSELQIARILPDCLSKLMFLERNWPAKAKRERGAVRKRSLPIPIEPSYDEVKARLAELEKQVDARKRSGSLEFKGSEKGGVSVYGLGRFPVTRYYEQWTRFLDASDKLREFLEENKSKVKLKGQ